MTNGPRLLIVDDDHALLDALPVALRLRMSPIEIDVVDSAGAALEGIRRVDYDVILTDIKMPGMDGLALLDAIQEIRPQTPTLLISGHGEHDLTIQALRGGAYDFIQKPIDRDYLVAAVERALHARGLQREVQAQRDALERHAADLERTVEERTHELRVANEAKDEFLGMISHEMRTPLTLIAGGVRVLRARGAELKPETHESVLKDIEAESSRLTRIVEDLLVLARTELGNDIVTEPVSLPALVERVTANIRASTSRTIEVQVEPGLPPVSAEETYLERVLTNLVSNADKYSLPGEPVRIDLGRANEGSAQVRVLDAGPGVAPEEIQLIFERFYRSGTTATRIQGVGMGLTVCLRLVEAMSGRIWAERTPDGGFEVGFTVPFYDERQDATPSAPGRPVLEAAAP